jgi:hypothetical protein
VTDSEDTATQWLADLLALVLVAVGLAGDDAFRPVPSLIMVAVAAVVLTPLVVALGFLESAYRIERDDRDDG